MMEWVKVNDMRLRYDRRSRERMSDRSPTRTGPNGLVRPFDSRPDQERPAHQWLESPCHPALYKEVGAGVSKHEVRRESAPHRQILIQSREGCSQ
jgi:hypothetical protein